MAFFLIFSMVLGLLNQLQIFSQLYLIELLVLLTSLGLLELWYLIYPRLLAEFGMLVFFTNLTLKDMCISESSIEIKIKLNVYFHTSLRCLERLYEGLKGLHKTFSGITKKCENKNLTLFFHFVRDWDIKG